MHLHIEIFDSFSFPGTVLQRKLVSVDAIMVELLEVWLLTRGHRYYLLFFFHNSALLLVPNLLQHFHLQQRWVDLQRREFPLLVYHQSIIVAESDIGSV